MLRHLSKMALALPSTSPSAIRGSHPRRSNWMERLQYSYVCAVAAAAGCNVSNFAVDEGVDLSLRHKSALHNFDDDEVGVDLQLKSHTGLLTPTSKTVKTVMSGRRFNEFAATDSQVPKVLVIMCIPIIQEHWVYARAKGLTVHRSAYWVSLRVSRRQPTRPRLYTLRLRTYSMT